MNNLSTMIVELLHELDKDFDPTLSSIINISNYAEKIKNNAKIMSYFDKGNLVAFIAFYCNDLETRIGFMSMLAVSKNNQGKGLARSLIKSSIDLLKNENFNRYRLEVFKTNNKAINLYKKMGFEVISELDFSLILELELKK
nr:GNAT family N-acetyltransferase [uncultured Flavobacterium sp.]